MTRRSIHIEGFDHGGQPIPAACRVGNIVMTGGVYGLDSATGQLPDDVTAQTRLMFAHLNDILSAAGTNLDEVSMQRRGGGWRVNPERSHAD
jgi:2-iminobutanoate/2-iminopropanoate deaminase